MAPSELRRRSVLAIGAHCDDIELGCGATLHKHRADWDVTALVFSVHFRSHSLLATAHVALDHLGVRSRHFKQYRNHEMAPHRQAVWQAMADLRDQLRPELVLAPAADHHEDHAVVSRESLRVFRHARVLAYEIPRSNPTFAPNTWEVLPEESAHAKCQALFMYEDLQRDYLQPHKARATMTHRGIYVEAEYAEAFQLLHDGGQWQ